MKHESNNADSNAEQRKEKGVEFPEIAELTDSAGGCPDKADAGAVGGKKDTAPADASDPDSPAALKAEIARLKAELDLATSAKKTAETAADEFKDKYLRLAAEFDNYRKRTQKHQESLYADAQLSTVAKFLPMHDNLSRALSQKTEDAAFYKGIELMAASFADILGKLGVKPLESLGSQFDPNLHEAIAHTKDESDESNVVDVVFQEGFVSGDKVIRHAMVSVKN